MSEPLHPIHPDVLPKLDPEFVAYYNANLANQPYLHELPWNPDVRRGPPVAGASQPLEVGFTKDISLSKCKARVFWPEKPSDSSKKWPVLLFFHGGGWTLGNINTEAHFTTTMCMKARCIVVSVDYRLAPENPYPAAVEDAVEAMLWIHKHGVTELCADLSRFAVGGSSSGANLAAVLTHKAAISYPEISLMFQQLVVPVVDNTAMVSGDPYPSWKENQLTPSLNPGRMLWFRDFYLPKAEDRKKWDNSPIFAPDESFKSVPDAWIAVAELDILRDEGLAYAEKLKQAGHKVEIKVYKNSTHPVMAMDGSVLKAGRELIADAAQALKQAFYTEI